MTHHTNKSRVRLGVLALRIDRAPGVLNKELEGRIGTHAILKLLRPGESENLRHELVFPFAVIIKRVQGKLALAGDGTFGNGSPTSLLGFNGTDTGRHKTDGTLGATIRKQNINHGITYLELRYLRTIGSSSSSNELHCFIVIKYTTKILGLRPMHSRRYRLAMGWRIRQC